MPQGLKLLDSAQEGRGVGGGRKRKRKKGEIPNLCGAQENGTRVGAPTSSPFSPRIWSVGRTPLPRQGETGVGGGEMPRKWHQRGRILRGDGAERLRVQRVCAAPVGAHSRIAQNTNTGSFAPRCRAWNVLVNQR